MTFRPLAIRLALLLVGLVWLALAHPQAQTAPVISWTHSGANVTHFQIVIGTTGTWVVDAGLPTPSGTTYEYALPALPAGTWQIKVRACYGADCQDSAAMTVVKMVPAGATALNYYWVDDDGAVKTWANCKSDTPLSGAAACTRATAMTNAEAGQTVWFRAGTYMVGTGVEVTSTGIAPTNSGSPGSPITFAAHPDETPTITDAGTSAFTYGVGLSDDAYIVVRGFDFKNLGASGNLLSSSYNEIAYNNFYNEVGNDEGGSLFIGGDYETNTWSTHNWIHHNTFARNQIDSDPCGEGKDLMRFGAGIESYSTIANDEFTTATGWTLGSGWTHNAGTGKMDKDADGTGTLVETTMPIYVGTKYRLRYTISGMTAGSVTASVGGASGTARTADGTYDDYIDQVQAVNTDGITFTPSNDARFSLDSIRFTWNLSENHYNTVENNVFATTAHTTLDNMGGYIVVRNNVTHNEPWITGCGNHRGYAWSYTSEAVETGTNKTVTVSGSTRSFDAGDPVTLHYYGDETISMTGTVVSYAAYVLTFDVASVTGSGTYRGWVIDKMVSTTSVALGTGSKTFTVNGGVGGKSLSVGSTIGAVCQDDEGKAIKGVVASWTKATGVLVITASGYAGTGTCANWLISFENYPYYTNSAYNGKYGHRNFQLTDDYANVSTHVILEGNRIGHASNNPGNGGPMNLDAAAPGNIIRYNDIYNGMSSGIYFKYARSDQRPCDGYKTNSGDCGGVDNRIYHNTIYHNGHGYNWQAYAYQNMSYSNLGIAQYDGATPDGVTGNDIRNNIIYDNYGGDVCYLGLGTPAAPKCVTPATTDTVENNWLTPDGDPQFVSTDVSDATSLTLPNLKLQSGSGAIGAASSLTLASGSGSTSTTLIVDDSTYFQDGSWGTALATGKNLMFADWIAIGTVDNVVEIDSIDYATNTITLASAKTWADNAPIWLYKKSDGVVVLVGAAPDYGAHEYGAGTASAPTGVVVR